MGRTGKGTSLAAKGQPETDSRECLSVDDISELMKDFTCASLLTKANQNVKKGQKSSVKESHANCCEDIASSLKHFHLKTPVNKRTRLKEKKNLERRSKTVLENKYNLSVAAIHSQTSVLWPGKLSCLSSKRADSSSDVIIRPSRLSISGLTGTPSKASSLPSPIHTSSSEEKARIAATLFTQNVPQFGDLKGKEINNGLSFSKLCNKNSKHSAAGNDVANSLPLPASIKLQAYRNTSTNSQQLRNGAISTDHSLLHCSSSASNLGQGSLDKYKMWSSSSQLRQSPHGFNDHGSSPLAASVFTSNNNNNDTHPSTYSLSPPPHTTSSCLPSSSSVLPSVSTGSVTSERSCSEEMRMEESNVNELASYFEDLLHIPRKMSVMAEMMYA